MPPYALQSSSIRYLDLRGTNQLHTNQYYNGNQCSALIRSPLAIQCEFLIITVEKRAHIIDLLQKLKHLRTLNVRCLERKSNDDDTIKWLQSQRSIPSTCSFAKDSKYPGDIRIWIR